MAILALQSHELPGFLWLYLAENPWKALATTLYGRSFDLPAEVANEKEAEEWFKAFEEKACYRYLLRRLNAKNYSTFELKKLLQRLKVSLSAQNQALLKCQQMGFLNDEEWIQRFVEAEARKGRGPHLIRAKLQAKGVPSATIDALSLSTSSNEDAIRSLVAGRYRKFSLEQPEQKRKLIGSLLRRGYRYEEVMRVLNVDF